MGAATAKFDAEVLWKLPGSMWKLPGSMWKLPGLEDANTDVEVASIARTDVEIATVQVLIWN